MRLPQIGFQREATETLLISSVSRIFFINISSYHNDCFLQFLANSAETFYTS